MTTTETHPVDDRNIAEIAPDGDAAQVITRRVDRLNTASLRKVIEPDTDVAGALGPGQVFATELSVTADLDLGLTDQQKVRLSREEMASVVVAGIRFEAILMSGFAEQIAHTDNIVDPRIVYMLHEIGEETRHSRLFLRLVEQLEPTAKSPADTGIANFIFRHVTRFVIHRPAALCVLVLAGEEIPDLIQKKLVEHPDTDPFLKSVNRYHRQEEARHLAYARMVLPELWEEASWVDRWTVKYLLPNCDPDDVRLVGPPRGVRDGRAARPGHLAGGGQEPAPDGYASPGHPTGAGGLGGPGSDLGRACFSLVAEAVRRRPFRPTGGELIRAPAPVGRNHQLGMTGGHLIESWGKRK